MEKWINQTLTTGLVLIFRFYTLKNFFSLEKFLNKE